MIDNIDIELFGKTMPSTCVGMIEGGDASSYHSRQLISDEPGTGGTISIWTFQTAPTVLI
jgi:hypothetical protein